MPTDPVLYQPGQREPDIHLETIPLDNTAFRPSSLTPSQTGLTFPSRALSSSSKQAFSPSLKLPQAQDEQLHGKSSTSARPDDSPAPSLGGQTYQSVPQDEPTKDPRYL